MMAHSGESQQRHCLHSKNVNNVILGGVYKVQVQKKQYNYGIHTHTNITGILTKFVYVGVRN